MRRPRHHHQAGYLLDWLRSSPAVVVPLVLQTTLYGLPIAAGLSRSPGLIPATVIPTRVKGFPFWVRAIVWATTDGRR